MSHDLCFFTSLTLKFCLNRMCDHIGSWFILISKVKRAKTDIPRLEIRFYFMTINLSDSWVNTNYTWTIEILDRMLTASSMKFPELHTQKQDRITFLRKNRTERVGFQKTYRMMSFLRLERNSKVIFDLSKKKYSAIVSFVKNSHAFSSMTIS